MSLCEGGARSPPRTGAPDRHDPIAEQQGDEVTLTPMKRAQHHPVLDALKER